MHTLMILTALAIAWCLRLIPLRSTGNWQKRWQQALFFFLFPPLLLLMTAIAVSCMGYQGMMLGWQASWFGYIVAVSFTIVAGILLVKLFYRAWQSQQQISTYPQRAIAGKIARIIDIDFPYSAQIGLWQPQLVISQGLLKVLDRDRLQAVLAHEQAHYNYRDTFWFFWLGWLRSLVAWLPNTEALWQELLLLRELRADRQAVREVDPLLLAESLLVVAQQVSQSSPLNTSASFCAALNDVTSYNRLEERINLILAQDYSYSRDRWWSWSWLVLVLLPLVTVPLHY